MNEKPKTWNNILESAHTATEAYRKRIVQDHVEVSAPIKNDYRVDKDEYDVYLLWSSARELMGRDLPKKLLHDIAEVQEILKYITSTNLKGE